MPILSILVVLLVIVLLYWAITKIMAAFGIGDPIHTVVIVCYTVAVILYLLAWVGFLPGGSVRLR